MEMNNKIIIILVVALVVVAGVLMLQSASKESSKLVVKSDLAAVGNSNFSVKLTDLNGTPIPGKDVDFSLVDDEGRTVKQDTDRTDEKGNAKVSMDVEKGEYKIEVLFAGDDKYAGCGNYQKLKIGENEFSIEDPQ